MMYIGRRIFLRFVIQSITQSHLHHIFTFSNKLLGVFVYSISTSKKYHLSMKLSNLIWGLSLFLTAQAVNPWQAKHGLTSSQYQTAFSSLASEGYRLNYVSGYTINNVPTFAAIWEKKSSPAWVANHGMTAADYQTKFNTYTSQGYRLVLVNGYTVNGVDNYVAIWDKSPSGLWAAKHGMTSTDYQTNFDSYARQGYRLKHVSGYAVGTEARYAAIWEKVTDGIPWAARHGMTSAEYQTQFDSMAQSGYRLVLVDGYQVGNTIYYAAIWEKKGGPALYARHGMTSAQYQGEFDNTYYQGYMLKVISGYDQGQSDRYAAIWENGPMSADDLATMDKDINAYMSKYNIPGLSLAITRDDRLVFAKGYGLADQAANIKVTPNSMFRIMSISKSITATAIMKLIDGGHFKITDKVFGPGSVLGTKYGTVVVNGVKQYKTGVTSITIQNLLEHQSGWGANSDPEQLLKTKTPAEAVSAVIDTIPLANTPNTVHFYSNFGFLVLGRVIADVSGQSYEDYVKNNILSQCQVTRMQLANNAGPISNEVQYYPLGVTNGFRIHEFDSFGGWLATPIDLCKLSVRVDQIASKSDILSSTSLTKMFEASSLDGGYGKGWIVNQPWRGHNGAFGGTGSFFTQRTDGFGFALVMNTNAVGDEYSFGIRGVVDAAITKVTSWPAYDLF
jgi:CubicO group peptidase (beta-lactamase class C family)